MERIGLLERDTLIQMCGQMQVELPTLEMPEIIKALAAAIEKEGFAAMCTDLPKKKLKTVLGEDTKGVLTKVASAGNAKEYIHNLPDDKLQAIGVGLRIEETDELKTKTRDTLEAALHDVLQCRGLYQVLDKVDKNVLFDCCKKTGLPVHNAHRKQDLIEAFISGEVKSLPKRPSTKEEEKEQKKTLRKKEKKRDEKVEEETEPPKKRAKVAKKAGAKKELKKEEAIVKAKSEPKEAPKKRRKPVKRAKQVSEEEYEEPTKKRKRFTEKPAAKSKQEVEATHKPKRTAKSERKENVELDSVKEKKHKEPPKKRGRKRKVDVQHKSEEEEESEEKVNKEDRKRAVKKGLIESTKWEKALRVQPKRKAAEIKQRK